ncbi:DUF2818 family protein [Rhodoferax sp.]|uniref:DUF2818 family protein n=1 Tax=Rhodoferax sp. TaxID=50421 RepID=UPI00374D38F6
MTQTVSVWLVLLAAIVAANLPFMSHRLLAIFLLPRPKSLALRLGELVVYYFVVGGLGVLLENHAGQIAPQGWEFYAITATLFITLAFPGFVARYLLKQRI